MSQREESNKRRALGSVENLLLKTPMYEELALKDRDGAVKSILTYDGALDTYCPGCKQTATFRGVVTTESKRSHEMERAASASFGGGGGGRFTPWAMRNVSKTLICTRAGHPIEFYFVCEADHLVKVGQIPSMADIEKGDTDKYEPVLGRERLQEFNRAIGLSAHGVGIGAHVYLRRIFEGLVEEVHQVSIKNQKDWDEAAYQKGRMAERIKLLKGLLPEFLTENPRLYGILSLGVHELTERECLANFEALKLCIEVILDQKLQEKGRKDKTEAAKAALEKIDGARKVKQQ